MGLEEPIRDSDQLDLWGLEVVAVSRLPWGGRSPRDLTRARKALFSSQGAQKSVSELVATDQLELFPEATKGAPAEYAGAPLLLPVKRRVR